MFRSEMVNGKCVEINEGTHTHTHSIRRTNAAHANLIARIIFVFIQLGEKICSIDIRDRALRTMLWADVRMNYATDWRRALAQRASLQLFNFQLSDAEPIKKRLKRFWHRAIDASWLSSWVDQRRPNVSFRIRTIFFRRAILFWHRVIPWSTTFVSIQF